MEVELFWVIVVGMELQFERPVHSVCETSIEMKESGPNQIYGRPPELTDELMMR